MRWLTVGIVLIWAGALAQGPTYFWAEVVPPEGAVAALLDQAQTLSIPMARWGEGALVFQGVAEEAELLRSEKFLLWDPPYFLIAIKDGAWVTTLRGTQAAAELVIFGTGEPQALSGPPFLEALGLIAAHTALDLQVKEIPLKLPAPPAGMKLDPILWALVSHPDWFGFVRDYGLERVGLRVRVVAELTAPLGQAFEGYILSSTDSLAELLLPIPMLPTLGLLPEVKIVRLPYRPEPLGG
ncbi:MAG: hypothetical protein ACUVQS_07230 [Candidatus Bipolaricaulaceae bacterium]